MSVFLIKVQKLLTRDVFFGIYSLTLNFNKAQNLKSLQNHNTFRWIICKAQDSLVECSETKGWYYIKYQGQMWQNTINNTSVTLVISQRYRKQTKRIKTPNFAKQCLRASVYAFCFLTLVHSGHVFELFNTANGHE